MKIVFLQPGYAHYRKKLFEILSEKFDIYYIFVKSKRTYPGNSHQPDIDCCYVDKRFRIAAFGILYYLIKKKPEIVITSGTTSLRTIISYLYAKFFSKKLIVWVLEWKDIREIYDRKKIILIIKEIIRQWIVKKCDAIVVGGIAAYRYMINYGKSNSDIFIANQTTNDLSKIKIINDKKFQEPKKYVFLYLSRIIELKGLDILIKSYYLLRNERDDVSLLIAGDGPFRGYCINLCKNLNLEDVEYIGQVEPDNLSNIYVRGSVFILPSYFYKNNYESWGLVINEAMSMGLPIITTNAVGASFDMVMNKTNGFIVNENNVDELYKAMKKILTLDLQKMSENSTKIFKVKNSYSKMAMGFEKAIIHVIDES